MALATGPIDEEEEEEEEEVCVHDSARVRAVVKFWRSPCGYLSENGLRWNKIFSGYFGFPITIIPTLLHAHSFI